MEGEQRAHLFALTQSRPFLSGTLLKVNEETPQDGSEIKAYVRALKKNSRDMRHIYQRYLMTLK